VNAIACCERQLEDEVSERFQAIAISIPLIAVIAWLTFSSLSSGRVSTSRTGRHFAYRDKNPISFWFHVGVGILLLVFATFSLLVALFL
jgi:hypothetical protein